MEAWGPEVLGADVVLEGGSVTSWTGDLETEGLLQPFYLGG